MKFILNKILPFVGFFISFVVWSNTNVSGYEWYFIVPLLFSIYALLDSDIYERAYNNIGFAIFFLTAVFRYLLTPLIASLSGYSTLFGATPSSQEYQEAVGLIIYEEVAVFALLYYLQKKYYKRKDYLANSIEMSQGIGRKPLFVFMCLLAVLTVLAFPQMFANIHFAGNLSDMDLSETIVVDVPFAGVFTEILSLGRLLGVLLIMDYLWRRSKKTKSYKMAILISVAFIMLNASFVTNLSRFGIIVPIISYTYLLMSLYRRQKGLIVTTMFSIVLGVVVVMSAVKFFSEDRNASNYESNDVNFWGDTMQMYFMGVKETAVGVRAEDQVDLVYSGNKFMLFLNDTFSNVIGLSNFTESRINTVHLYNYVYFPRGTSVSQIPPNVINGLYYFGRWAAPLYTLFFVYLFAFLDYKARHCKRIVDKFALLYGALYCSLCMMINGAMLCSFLVNDTLILLLYSKLNYFVSKKSR